MPQNFTYVTADKQAKKIAHNTVSNIIILFLEGFTGLYLVRFLLANLGDTAYGTWKTVGGVLAYVGLLQFGLNSAVNWLVPGCLAKHDENGVNRIVNTANAYYFLLSLVVLLATLTVAKRVPGWLNIPVEYEQKSIIVFLIVGISFALRLLLNVFFALLSGFQVYVVLNIVRGIVVVVRLFLLLVFISRGFGLIVLGLIYGGTELLGVILYAVISFTRINYLKIRVQDISVKLFSKMFTYGFNTMLFLLSGIIMSGGTFVLISILLNPKNVTLYAIPLTLILTIQRFTVSMVKALKPATASLHALGKMDQVRLLFLRTQKYMISLLTPMILFVVFMSRPLIDLWIKDQTKVVMAPILGVLAVSYFFFYVQQGTGFILVGLGKHRFPGILTAITLTVYLVLAVLLVKVFNLGLWGITIGMVVPLLVVNIFVLPIYSCRVLQVPIGQVLKKVWLKPVITAIPVGGLLAVLSHKLYPTNWWLLLSEALFVGIFSIGLNWRFSIDAAEKRFFIKLLDLRKSS